MEVVLWYFNIVLFTFYSAVPDVLFVSPEPIQIFTILFHLILVAYFLVFGDFLRQFVVFSELLLLALLLLSVVGL